MKHILSITVTLIALTTAMTPLDALPQQSLSHIPTMQLNVRTNTGEMVSLHVPRDDVWHHVDSDAVTCFRECTDLILHEATMARHSLGICRLASDFIGKTFDVVNNGTVPLVKTRTDPPYHILHICCGGGCVGKQPVGWPEPVVVGDEEGEKKKGDAVVVEEKEEIKKEDV